MTWSIDVLEEHLLIGSTLVEGSTLTESEARDVLAGRTVQGHSVREIRELSNYRAATEWLLEQLDASPYLSLDLLLGFHARLMDGLSDEAGRLKAYSNHTIRTDGTRYDYVHPAQVQEAIAVWLDDFNRSVSDAVTRGAELYARFQSIHPFADGNGRIGRVLLAYFIHREAGRLFRFHARDKVEHLRAVEATDTGDLQPLEQFIRQRLDR